MPDSKSQTTDDEAPHGLATATTDFELTPMVGLVVSNDNASFWLSWDETQQLAKFLREHVGS